MPGGWIHAGQPVGAVVVGGGTTLNGASQTHQRWHQRGKQPDRGAQPVYGFRPGDASPTASTCSTSAAWFERLQSNSSLVQDQYGQASFSNLQTFLAGQREHVHLRAVVYAAVLAIARGRATSPKTRSSCDPAWNCDWVSGANLRMAGTRRTGRAANYVFDSNGRDLTQPVIGSSAFSVNNAKFLPRRA